MMNTQSKIFVALIATAGAAVMVYGAMHLGMKDPVRFLAFLAVTLVTSRMKLKLPGVNGNMSVNLPFILMAVAQLSLAEALVIACASTAVQSFTKSRQDLQTVKVVFNVCNIALSVGVASLLLRSELRGLHLAPALIVVCVAGGYLLANTVPVAAIISFSEHAGMTRTWMDILQLSLPYYLVGACIAAIMASVSQFVGWMVPLSVLPFMYAIYWSYKRYFAVRTVAAHAFD